MTINTSDIIIMALFRAISEAHETANGDELKAHLQIYLAKGSETILTLGNQDNDVVHTLALAIFNEAQKMNQAIRNN